MLKHRSLRGNIDKFVRMADWLMSIPIIKLDVNEIMNILQGLLKMIGGVIDEFASHM